MASRLAARRSGKRGAHVTLQERKQVGQQPGGGVPLPVIRQSSGGVRRVRHCLLALALGGALDGLRPVCCPRERLAPTSVSPGRAASGAAWVLAVGECRRHVWRHRYGDVQACEPEDLEDVVGRSGEHEFDAVFGGALVLGYGEGQSG